MGKTRLLDICLIEYLTCAQLFSDEECIVDRHKRYFEDLRQGGLEVPCKLSFEIESLQACNKTERLIHASLAVTSVEYPEASKKHREGLASVYTDWWYQHNIRLVVI